MHKLMIFLKRRPGMSHAAFRSYYEEHHVPLCLHYMSGVESYRRHYLAPGPDREESPCDVITELIFASSKVRDAVLDALRADAMPADVIADEENLFDRSQSRAFAVDLCETDLVS